MEYFGINKKKLPVSEDFLIPFLNPTSPGTNYWDAAPKVKIMDRQIGNSILQFSQLVSLLRNLNTDFENKSFLDIGTGDGVIPKLLLRYTKIKRAIGIDPYLAGEYIARRKADDNENFEDIISVIDKRLNGSFEIENFRDLLKFEHSALRPNKFKYELNEQIDYQFKQYGAHDCSKLNEKFDIIYCKAIEHIDKWDLILSEVSKSINKNGIFVIKHNSFFSYLGPHRYCATMIPWGHLVLSDDEYREYVKTYHKDRYEYTIKNYFESLTYPRCTLNQFLKLAQKNDFSVKLIINEPLRFLNKVSNFISIFDNFWDMVSENFPDLSSEEIFSGRYHIILLKNN